MKSVQAAVAATAFWLVTVHAAPPAMTREQALGYQPAEACVYKAPKGSGDPTTRQRNEKKAAKEYRRCVKQYRQTLIDDFHALRQKAEQLAVSESLAPDEAEKILEHMGAIQALLQQQPENRRPEAVLPTTTTDFYDRAHGR